MPKKVSRVVIDTNIWISFLISKDLVGLDEQIKNRSLKILFSIESLEEFLDVVGRPKFSQFFKKDEVEQLLELIDYYGELINVKSKIEVCRDAKDNFLLALAKDGSAGYLITGDKDLLVLREFESVRILAISDYLKLK